MKKFFLQFISVATLAVIFLGIILFPATAQNKTITLNWTPSTSPNVTQNVFRENASGACAITSVGTGPGCWKLNATALANTVTTFSDSVGSACLAASTSCAPPGTYFYVVRATDANGNSAQAESNSITVSLPPSPPTNVKAS